MTDNGADNTFPRELRLRRSGEFRHVYAGDTRVHIGPIVVWARPNELGHSRLGLAVSRRVGGAVERGRIKRMLRESFRLGRRELPCGYDLVVSVRAHEALSLEGYRTHLLEAARRLERRWQRKRRSDENAGPGSPLAD